MRTTTTSRSTTADRRAGRRQRVLARLTLARSGSKPFLSRYFAVASRNTSPRLKLALAVLDLPFDTAYESKVKAEWTLYRQVTAVAFHEEIKGPATGGSAADSGHQNFFRHRDRHSARSKRRTGQQVCDRGISRMP